MTAEVIARFEDEHARFATRLLAIEKGCGQATDAATHHDEVKDLACRFGCTGLVPEGAVPHGMEHGKGWRSLAAQAGKGRRIGGGSGFRCPSKGSRR
jgi:hypothetical protein